MKQRKLFCEISPLTYKISVMKCCFIRSIKNFLQNDIAYEKSSSYLPHSIYTHNSLIRRKLGNVNLQLQDNKAINLKLAAPKVSGILIKPNEEFSFWSLVGSCTKRKGYREGLVIIGDDTSKGIGGGMCQFTNLIHWLVLHTPLEITEHHHHDSYDLFPDYGRAVPFGTGTSILYNYMDYRFKNTTESTYQLIVYTTDTHLCGEIRCDKPLDVSYHITAENEYFSQESDGIYRNNTIYRHHINKHTGCEIKKEFLKSNHAKIMYDRSFVEDKIIDNANAAKCVKQP